MDPSSLVKTLEQVAETSASLVSTWGLSVLGAIAVLVVGRWIAGKLRKATASALERGNVDASLVPFVSSAIYYVALTVVVIAVLNLFGIETTSLIAVLGAASLAVGLALQGTLSNFAAGTMLLLFRPFRVGDYIEAAGSSGTVSEIGVFTTILNTPDNVMVTVPNSAISGETIRNYSANPTRRIDLVMGISYDDDIRVAMQAMRDCLRANESVLDDPEPQIAVCELADSAVNLVVRPWVQAAKYWDVRFELTRALKETLEAAGCSIPYPQQDVHVQSDDQASGRAA